MTCVDVTDEFSNVLVVFVDFIWFSVSVTLLFHVPVVYIFILLNS